MNSETDLPSELSDEIQYYAKVPEFIVIREDCTCYHGGIQTTTRWHVYDKALFLVENIEDFDVLFLSRHPELIDDEHAIKIYMGITPEDFLNGHNYYLNVFDYEGTTEEKFRQEIKKQADVPYQKKDWDEVVIAKPCSRHGNGVWKLTHSYHNCKYCVQLKVKLNGYTELDYPGEPE